MSDPRRVPPGGLDPALGPGSATAGPVGGSTATGGPSIRGIRGSSPRDGGRSGRPPIAAGPIAAGPNAAGPIAAGLVHVPSRPFLVGSITSWVELAPGDRALVAPGEAVIAGTPLAERLRDAQLTDAPTLAGDDPRKPGDRISAEAGGRVIRRAAAAAGELVFRSGRRWRVASGETSDPIEAPGSGIVRSVLPGSGISLELAGHAFPGAFAVGVPTRGFLSIATDAAGELHATALDVGRAGTILVVGSRVDAETLTRARAMGIRGIVVAALPGKELRDFAASERRQRAALHRLPPFAVLVLDGVIRRPIQAAVEALFEALVGREVGIVTDPPALLIPGELPRLAPLEPDRVRVRGGPDAGREGRWLGYLGSRRFRPGVHLDAGLVELDGRPAGPVPLADLERLA
jgi:hypothetical protein